MQQMPIPGLLPIAEHKANVEKVPLLGICLGMQLLTDCSEEGGIARLGWIQAETKRFPAIPGLKIPHMGWNGVVQHTASPLTRNLPADCRFYFVHSYYVTVKNSEHSILRTNYGVQFDSAIARDNIFGAQFHPEKSHKFGMQLLENFAHL